MRFRLAVRFSGKLLNTYEFDQDQVTIGRAPDCDVVIDNLGVSRVHARIERYGDVFVLRDLKSNNGTYVRGEKIQRYNLNNNDEFFLGKHSITFTYDEEEQDWDVGVPTEILNKKEEVSKDMQGMTMTIGEKELASLIQAKQQTHIAAYLSRRGASGVQQNEPITKTAIFFGSHPKCDYRIEGWFISKRHVLLLREETGFRLIHLGNKKPPKVNGNEVDDYKLKHGDMIDVEGIRLNFYMGSP